MPLNKNLKNSIFVFYELHGKNVFVRIIWFPPANGDAQGHPSISYGTPREILIYF
jgi:hypothetical protein